VLIQHNLENLAQFLPTDFTKQLVVKSNQNLSQKNGNIPKWDQALAYAQTISNRQITYNPPYLDLDIGVDESIVKSLIPWRKGPFSFTNFALESEWRGDIKWQRIKNHIYFKNKSVLDVGCGNGYFSCIFALNDAKVVLGLEPFLLFNYQFHFIKNLSNNLNNVLLAPLRLEELTVSAKFDLVFSMGVLYHHKSPITHLLELKNMLSDGKLILETLVVDGDEGYALTPEGRYAGMRNVWFIPSILTLKSWLKKCGFNKIQIISDDITDLTEQRATKWLGDNPKSLDDFICDNQTIEGHPRPRRLMLICNT
jgi:tRNA (mo5U34)-methyltransferase